MTSPCGDFFTCEECGDSQACDIYYAEKGYQLLEERYEEECKEQLFEEKEAQ
ncbi:MAG TPA: hypothetical protein VN368_02145 [Candidatus Methylomirabilis sp.]|nr:hypothetical protein [Candidatus Methylomirabilis sp.]